LLESSFLCVLCTHGFISIWFSCLLDILLFHHFFSFFFFNDPAPTYIYTLSLHDALPIFHQFYFFEFGHYFFFLERCCFGCFGTLDRKSTRLNSSHQIISYAVFCLKKKK